MAVSTMGLEPIDRCQTETRGLRAPRRQRSAANDLPGRSLRHGWLIPVYMRCTESGLAVTSLRSYTPAELVNQQTIVASSMVSRPAARRLVWREPSLLWSSSAISLKVAPTRWYYSSARKVATNDNDRHDL